MYSNQGYLRGRNLTHFQLPDLNYRYVDLLKFLEAPLVNVRRNI